MLGKRPQPLIGKISELLVSGGRAAVLFDALGSPRSPFDMMNLKMQSPKGLKSYDLGGVGLGIVVALDKSSSEEQGHVCTSNSNRSVPIPVTNQRGFQKGVNEIPAGSSEDYTFVTYHVPNNKTITKVYYDGGERGILTHGCYNINNNNNNNVGVGGVRRIPPTQTLNIEEDEPSYPTSDFLSSCHLCRKNLHGKDIYMYRGEKAFCSNECRSRQISMDDERKERCRSEASRSVEMSSSPYTARDQMFSTGIVAL